MSTSWIWSEDELETQAVQLDADEGVLWWHSESVGCCSMAPRAQTLADFETNGPLRYGNPPADVLAEMRTSVAALRQPA